MAEASLHIHLKSLQSLLRKLRSSAPSTEVKASIKEASQHLEIISGYLTVSEFLNQIDQELNGSLEPEQVVEAICRGAARGTDSTIGWVALSGDESADLMVLCGPEKGHAIPPESPLGQSITQCLSDSRPHCFPPQGQEPARLAAPLVHSGKPFGVLVVERSAAYPESALLFLSRLADRAASAIQNDRLSKALHDSLQDKTKFVSVVTHELRVPMTSIKGYTDLLRHKAVGPINEQQMSFLDIVRNNVERMSNLVSDLSDISHIEAGRLKLTLTDVRLRDALEETLVNLRPKIDEKHQTLSIAIPDDLPCLRADSNRLAQILANLINNANRYTQPEGTLNIRASRDDKNILVEVTDTGIGISTEDQARLFTQFFRSDDSLVREQQGWGLGLSVAKRLVEVMGGDIGAQSEYRKGSVFWFKLPISNA
jgi:signal transduction histidine kinase